MSRQFGSTTARSIHSGRDYRTQLTARGAPIISRAAGVPDDRASPTETDKRKDTYASASLRCCSTVWIPATWRGAPARSAARSTPAASPRPAGRAPRSSRSASRASTPPRQKSRSAPSRPPTPSSAPTSAAPHPAPLGGGAALFVLIHAAVCDRASSQAPLRELLALLAGDAEVKEEVAAAVEAGMERRIPKKDAWKPLWARGVDMVGYSIKSLRTSTLPFLKTGTARSTQMVRLRFGLEDTTRLLDACKKNGVRLCSAIAAAMLPAARQSKSGQQGTYSVATLINCRQFLEPPLDDHNVGFFYSAIANNHKMNKEEGLWVLARRCHDSCTNAKNQKKHLTDIRDLNFLMCRAIENPQLTPASALRTGLVSMFEEPATYDLSDLQTRAGVEDYVCCNSVHGNGASIGVFDSIREGQLDCACVYPTPLHSRKQIHEMIDKVKRILVQGSTSSDAKDGNCT